MKTSSIKFIVASIFSLLSFIGYAQQDFQGVAVYESKTTFNMDNWGRRGQQMSEQMKKQMAERMKSMLEKTYKLTFDKTASTYKEEEKLDAPGGGGFGRMMMGSFTAGAQYKNIKDQQLLQEQEFFGKEFLIKDSLPKLEWKMTNETKQIGQYMCFKATAMKPVDGFDWRNMRRRNRNNKKEVDSTKTDSTKTNDPMSEIEMPKEVEVVAWYTPQIPISQGPGEYHGLPGLILEVNETRTTILCSKIVMNPKEKEAIKVPNKGKEVTRKEYNDIVKKKMEEMREMYRGRGRGNFRRN